MDFFTDASLNSEKEIAGIGCVCIDDKKSETSEYSTFFKIDNIHFAELYALAFAVQKASALGVRNARIVSDSVSALNTLHYYIDAITAVRSRNLSSEQKQFLRNIDASPVQKKALDSIVDVFMTSGVSFKFVHANGHQKSAKVGSDGYWNKRADRAAKKIREFIELSESIEIPDFEHILPDISAKPMQDDWRDKIQAPYVQAKQKDKSVPKKVSRHKKSNEDTYNIRIMVNLRIKMR